MTAQTIVGTVESVKLERQDELGRTKYGQFYIPLKLSITLDLEDGKKAYASKTVGQHIEADRVSGDFLGLKEYDHLKSVNEWPLVTNHEGKVIRSDSPEVFPNAFVVSLSIIPTVWIGDKITIRGSVQEKVSRKGTRYLSVNRIRIISIERDGQVWGG